MLLKDGQDSLLTIDLGDGQDSQLTIDLGDGQDSQLTFDLGTARVHLLRVPMSPGAPRVHPSFSRGTLD